jgi:hypothetical protein
MSTLVIRAITPEGGWERRYDGYKKNPEFVRGFVLGYAAASGVAPDQIVLTVEE